MENYIKDDTYIDKDGIDTGMTKEEWIAGLRHELGLAIAKMDDEYSEAVGILESLAEMDKTLPDIFHDLDTIGTGMVILWEDARRAKLFD